MVKLVVIISLVFISAIHFGACQNADEMGDYFEGDIVGTIPTAPVARSGISNTRQRWANGVIPYSFEANYPQNLRDTFQGAIDHISSRTCIKFVPRTNQRDYVHIVSRDGCYSYVGKTGGQQVISLPRACGSRGVFVHELIHAIGFVHEQSRTDRDDYVKIRWENIQSGMSDQFKKYGTSMINAFGVPYDYGSIMHYSRFAFSKGNRAPTIEPVGNSQQRLGQRSGMSNGDITKINKMYNCPAQTTRSQTRSSWVWH